MARAVGDQVTVFEPVLPLDVKGAAPEFVLPFYLDPDTLHARAPLKSESAFERELQSYLTPEVLSIGSSGSIS
jgi:hypothetical protein